MALAENEMILPAIFAGVITEAVVSRIHEVHTPTFLHIHFLGAFLLSIYSFWFHQGGTSSLPEAAYTYATISVSYITGFLSTVVLYRLFFSPIAHFPAASLSSKLSRFPLFFINNSADYTTPIRRLHEKHGDVVRIGPNDLSVVNAAIIPMVYHRRTDFTSRGAFYEYSRITGGQTSLLTQRDPVIHRTQRAVWEKAFSKPALAGYEPRVRDHVTGLFEAIASAAEANGGDVELRVLLQKMAYGIMADLGFGVERGPKKLGEEASALQGMRSYIAVALVGSVFRNVCEVFPMFPQRIRDLFWNQSKTLQKRGREMLMGRMKMGMERKGGRDVFSYLLEGAEKKIFTLPDLAANSRLMIIAGSDTTSTVLTALLRAIALKPEYQSLLFAELTSAGLTSESGLLPDSILRSLPLLNAIITEALRFYNPVPAGIEVVAPPGGVTLPASSTRSGKEIYIPGMTYVRVPHRVLFFDERYFDRPYDFWPERWLPVEGDIAVEEANVGADGEAERPGKNLRGVKDKKAFIPWSWGAHSCVGRELAMTEMRIVVAGIVGAWEWRMKEKDAEAEQRKWDAGWKEWFTIEVAEIEVEMTRRV